MISLQQVEAVEAQLGQFKKFIIQRDAASAAIAANTGQISALQNELNDINNVLQQVAQLVEAK